MQPSLNFEEVLEQILARDTRYQRDAYFFVRDALDVAQRKFAPASGGKTSRNRPAHVSGQQLLEGIRAHALEQFGPLTLMVLEEWGVRRCEDFGEIVFNMVESSLLGKTENDTREARVRHGMKLRQTIGSPGFPTPEAELRALRAQLNPHFLFNSLNSINALIGSDPEGARRMCERLGDFLRRSLALGAREVVTLGEELILVERYLDIEQLRFGARLRVEVEVADVLRECLVPPLLLQPLVENAIKHGIQDLVEGGVVRLEAHGEGERLSITVTNPIDGDAPLRTGEGVGLANVQRRLVAWGEEAANLRADRTPDHFRVALTLPLRRREEAHR